MTKKPLKAAYKIDDDIKACPTVFKVAKDNLPGDLLGPLQQTINTEVDAT